MSTAPKNPRGWSEEHLDAIRRFYPSHGAPHVASLVGRSVRSVHYMAAELSLQPEGRVKRAFEWTDEQIAILRREYEVSGPHVVAELVGRKVHSVYSMASELHLKAPPRKKAAPTEKPAAPPKQRAPARPHIVSAKVLRGPAHLPGEPVITDRTRYVVGPRMKEPTHTNTHSAF